MQIKSNTKPTCPICRNYLSFYVKTHVTYQCASLEKYHKRGLQQLVEHLLKQIQAKLEFDVIKANNQCKMTCAKNICKFQPWPDELEYDDKIDYA